MIKRYTISLIIGIAGCILLTACGQKGPLYLPAPNECQDGKNHNGERC